MLLGVSASLVAALWSPVWSDFSFFVVLLVVLLIRPRGLFGTSLRGAV
jgi:branched-chain amino acid transport system permease protein